MTPPQEDQERVTARSERVTPETGDEREQGFKPGPMSRIVWSCCACCTVPDDPTACGFNRARDTHVSPCEECKSLAYDHWAMQQPKRGGSDVPF